ncbi:beta-lactamase/transpeptidase-like protein [Phaeosphaeria sp. MPI-PUGE-AT-0046c]|nr:beta-lactamase/transpeptidase-like protein [Phaeosphaeria sp. MPI-PUGE-AT-0046c]
MKKLREKLHRKATAPRNAHTPNVSPIFDSELEDIIKDILQQCVTKTATISVRRQIKREAAEHQLRTIVASDDSTRQHTTADGNYVYHIASLSKILVAIAVFVAVEKSPSEDGFETLLERFRHAQHEPLTRLFNEYKDPKIHALPGNPTIYDLLVHRKGVPSSNHRLLTPTGCPIMAQSDVWDELISRVRRNTSEGHTGSNWAGYSNVNYALVAMVAEAMWDGSIQSFIEEMLLLPLGMHATSIGVSMDERIDNRGRVVDASGMPHDIERPQYQSDGAEAAAFGIYSTANDLDTFFKFIIDTFHWNEPLRGFDLTALSKALKMTYEPGESLLFTPFGLYTTLGSSVVGSLSPNRALFPEDDFSNYTVTSSRDDDDIPVYYMAGSAIASGCATALHVGQEYSFAIVVLTDTSGPVDAADHILRLVLQRMAQWMGKLNSTSTFKQPINVKDMVTRNKNQALRKWQELEQKHVRDLRNAHTNSKTIAGVYKGVDFNQRLVIIKGDDGKTYITVDGPLRLQSSAQLEMYWIDDSNVKFNIPLHLSVDWLDGADWSNTTFEVEDKDQVVQALVRTTAYGKDRYLRVPP